MTPTHITLRRLLDGTLKRGTYGEPVIAYDSITLIGKQGGGIRVSIMLNGEQVAYMDVLADWSSDSLNTLTLAGFRGEIDIRLDAK